MKLGVYRALKKGKGLPGQPNVIHDDHYGDVERYLARSSRHVIVETVKKRAGQQVRALKILSSAGTETRWILNESENRGRGLEVAEDGDGAESCTRLILNVAGQATGPIKRPKQVRTFAGSRFPCGGTLHNVSLSSSFSQQRYTT